MKDPNNTDAMVYDADSGKKLAQIVLNGYNISAGGPLGKTGAMRSFKIVDGDLFDQWDLRSSLLLHAEDGRVADARVAALPAEDESYGLMEFL